MSAIMRREVFHDEDFDHEHLRDVLPDWNEGDTDIVVSRTS